MVRLLVIFLVTMNVFILLYAPQPLLPDLARQYGIAISTASLTISVTIISLALSSFVMAPWLDRWARKKVIVLSSFLLVVPSIMLTFTDSFAWILIWRAVHGLCIPGVTAVLVAYISEEYPSEHRGKVTGIYISATVAGGLVGRVIAGPIAEAFSWHAVFGTIALYSLAVSLLVLCFLPQPQKQSVKEISGFKNHMRNRALIGTFFIGFSQFFTFIGFFTYLPFYVSAEPFLMSATQISYLYATYLFGVLSAPFAGYLSDRIGRRQTMAIGHCVGGLGILITLYPSLSTLLLGASMLALGNFASQSATTAYVTDIARGSKGAAASLYLVFFYVGGSLGAFLPGLLWGFFAWKGLVSLTVASIVLALLINFFIAGPQKHKTELDALASHSSD